MIGAEPLKVVAPQVSCPSESAPVPFCVPPSASRRTLSAKFAPAPFTVRVVPAPVSRTLPRPVKLFPPSIVKVPEPICSVPVPAKATARPVASVPEPRASVPAVSESVPASFTIAALKS